MNLASARAALASAAPDMVMRKAESGDYRVTFALTAIARAFPGMGRAALIIKAESLACYESDAQSAMESGIAMARVGLLPDSAPVSLITESGHLDLQAELKAGAREVAPATPRRDNVEYHAGRKARADGVGLGDCPYSVGGARAARWNLGWTEQGPTQTIDATPTWQAILPLLRAAIENGNSTGQAIAWQELTRMAGLADERNQMATRLADIRAAMESDIHPVTKLIAIRNTFEESN